MFCAEEGLSAPNGTCDPGFYCSLAADNPTPTDGVTGMDRALYVLVQAYYY